MLIKNKEVLALWNALHDLSAKRGARFTYAITKTKQQLRPIVYELHKMQAPSRELVEYDQKRVELCNKHAEKDKEGNPLTTGNNYVLANNEEFTKEFAVLQEEYKDHLLNHEKKLVEFRKILDIEVDVDIHRVFVNDCPADITTEEMESIFLMVSEK